MLSNFQQGQQALLKTFLVGQPEFRNMLHSPAMLQLRQRVAASCHLGPLDVEDTRSYIEHRLRKAGATDKPSFEPEVFGQIYEQTDGIPRRINSLCDRLLLHGFLSEITHFTPEVLAEVVAELQEEQALPDTSNARPASRLADAVSGLVDLDLDPEQVDGLAAQIANASADQLGARLHRIEQSVLQQERVNQEILAVLHKIIGASRKLSGTDETTP